MNLSRQATARYAAATGFLSALLVLGLALAGSPAAFAQDADSSPVAGSGTINLLPSQRRGLKVRDDERNPFADRVPDLKPLADEESGKTEDDQLRIIFSELTVSGISRGPSGLRVLMGDLILEEGAEVPPLLRGQAARLVVSQITEQELELSWLDPESGEVTPKKLLVAYDLSPSVSFVLQGQRESKEGALRFGRLRKAPGGEVSLVAEEEEGIRVVDPARPVASAEHDDEDSSIR